MSALRRFPLTYDDEYDADITNLLANIPVKRRSERLRQLIRLGLKTEKQEGSADSQTQAFPLPNTTNQNEQAELSGSNITSPNPVATKPESQRKTRVPRFTPPT